MKVYLRADPLMDERKAHYTPSQFGAFVKVWLMLGRASDPGRFRGSVDDLRRALPAGFAKHVGFLVAQGDLVRRDGYLYFDGWDEWQEGDLTVRERVARLRARRKKGEDVTPDVTLPSVTEPPEHPPDTYATSTSTLRRDVPDILPLVPLRGVPPDLPDPEDVRLRAEESRGRDRPPDLDPLFELLTQIGLFEHSPNHRRLTARRLRVWGFDLEDVARAWEACGTALNPVAAFAKSAQEPGRFKALVARAGPPPRATRIRAVPPPVLRPNLLDGFGPPPRRDLPARVESLPAWSMPRSTSRSPFRGER